MNGRKRTRPRLGRSVLIALVLLLAVPGSGRAQDAAVYEFEVTLAPYCLDGTFPITVDAPAGKLAGDASLATDAKGKLTGSLSIEGAEYVITGKVTFKKAVSKLTLVAKAGKDRIDFKGELAGGAFTGTTKGKGSVAKGKGTFSLDVSGADPSVAGLVLSLTTNPKGKLGGTGTVAVTGTPVDLKVSGKDGKKFKLKLKGKGFKFDGTGLVIASGVVVVWKAKGFGATASGDGLTLPIVPSPSGLVYAAMKVEYEDREPIAPNFPTAGGGEVKTWSIAPTLPAGLSFNPATGRITGTPTSIFPATDYTVTAGNVAGEATAKLVISVRVNRADSLAPQPGPLTDADRRHFLTRTSFGVTLEKLSKMEKQSLSQYVDGMLTFKKGTKEEKAAAVELVNEADPPGLEGQFPSETDLARWWAHLLMRNDNPFQEVMALFWHDHFATSSEVLSSDRRRWMIDHVNLWRHRGNGNLRDLLVSMTRDWAMLRWLDNISNQKKAPNENFAREFWELFTLGVDNGYSQADILEAARAFTGYRERYDDVKKLRFIEFDVARHDPDAKSFFGRTIPAQNTGDDYEAVVDITLSERPVAEFICAKLFAHFCYENPPQAVIDAMAAELRAKEWELKPVLKMLLTSEAFFSKDARHGFVKSPVEFSVGFIRTTGLVIRNSSLDGSLKAQGQRPTQPPTVDGWPEGGFWLSAQGMVERANLVLTCITDRTRQEDAGVDVADILPPANQRSAAEVVTSTIALMRVTVSAADRVELIDYLNTNRKSDGSTEPSPFNGTDTRHIDERVRGLLYILAQHPTYHTR